MICSHVDHELCVLVYIFICCIVFSFVFILAHLIFVYVSSLVFSVLSPLYMYLYGLSLMRFHMEKYTLSLRLFTVFSSFILDFLFDYVNLHGLNPNCRYTLLHASMAAVKDIDKPFGITNIKSYMSLVLNLVELNYET